MYPQYTTYYYPQYLQAKVWYDRRAALSFLASEGHRGQQGRAAVCRLANYSSGGRGRRGAPGGGVEGRSWGGIGLQARALSSARAHSHRGKSLQLLPDSVLSEYI